jgi:hypothetical protein
MSRNQKDVFWVIVDRLTKIAHFILVNICYSLEKYISKKLFVCIEYHQVLCPIEIRGLHRDFRKNFKNLWDEI